MIGKEIKLTIETRKGQTITMGATPDEFGRALLEIDIPDTVHLGPFALGALRLFLELAERDLEGEDEY